MGAREANDRSAFFISSGGIRVPGREILAVDFEGFAAPAQALIAQDRADGKVVLRVGRCRVAWADQSLALPVEEVFGEGEASLIARAVEADVQHIEPAVGSEDDGVVDALLVEVTCLAGSLENQIRILVRSPVGCDGIGRSIEVRRGKRESGRGEARSQEVSAACLHGACSWRTATPCAGSVMCVAGMFVGRNVETVAMPGRRLRHRPYRSAAAGEFPWLIRIATRRSRLLRTVSSICADNWLNGGVPARKAREIRRT